jgi:hypothetical protein
VGREIVGRDEELNRISSSVGAFAGRPAALGVVPERI